MVTKVTRSAALRVKKAALKTSRKPTLKHAGPHEHETTGRVSVLERNLPILARSMTFSRMVKSNADFLRQLKDFEWLFPILCRRKDQAAMTECEKSRYICAYNMINNDGTLGELVDIHHGMHMQHTNARLLPWHRVFLYLFEEALHNYHPDVCIPCWDWTQPEQQIFPSWLSGFQPTVHTPTRTINVVRSPGSGGDLASIASVTPTAMAKTDYGQFSSLINGIHGSVHIWVGGTMSDASVSPADPIFWLHHANLDRLWWVWYNSPQGNHQNPPLAGADAVMDPWTYTETDVRNITSLGYTYA